MRITEVRAVVKSEKELKEFVLHVPTEYDYHYSCDE